ncbi:hypothetical protein CERSUDRAFT_100179 [Gelatoporia subvermispora B]|uniref:EH domain-containing protein n=1 Tax=Ceriporiopsis subvermispora (strain B) TaxID=914234 RepID=M2P8J4_CERS8|nr:hypothetical protein CERSUDRAFT_100179 [Gelatoporia subvermispora B]
MSAKCFTRKRIRPTTSTSRSPSNATPLVLLFLIFIYTSTTGSRTAATQEDKLVSTRFLIRIYPAVTHFCHRSSLRCAPTHNSQPYSHTTHARRYHARVARTTHARLALLILRRVLARLKLVHPPPLASSTRSSSTSLSLEYSASRTPSILRTASACTLPERGNGSVRFAPLPAIEPRRRKSSVQLGVAARSRMLRQRRMLREQGELLQAHPDAAGWGPEEGEVHFHQEDVLHAHTPQDTAKFLKLFLQCGPANGLLSGEKARDVFVKSKLPVDKLSQIWSLADTKNRGALDATDFAIAMHLIQASMSGQIPNIPSTLPPSLYEQAGGKTPHCPVYIPVDL